MIYICNTTMLMQADLYRRAYEAASAERRKKADRFRFQKDRNLSIAAGLLLDYGLRQGGLEPSDRQLAYGAYGKPYVCGHPEVSFNLSHAGEWVMCILENQPVGCDLEKIGPVDLDIARQYFGPEECALIFSQEEEKRLEAFYRCWTLRESYIKALGLGMQLPASHYFFRFGDRITVCRNGAVEPWYFTEIEKIPGYRAAVCTRRERPLQVQEVSIEELLQK